ncbi:hypothetical protein DOY81_014219, partial [Sarcophaga bullata]
MERHRGKNQRIGSSGMARSKVPTKEKKLQKITKIFTAQKAVHVLYCNLTKQSNLLTDMHLHPQQRPSGLF